MERLEWIQRMLTPIISQLARMSIKKENAPPLQVLSDELPELDASAALTYIPIVVQNTVRARTTVFCSEPFETVIVLWVGKLGVFRVYPRVGSNRRILDLVPNCCVNVSLSQGLCDDREYKSSENAFVPVVSQLVSQPA